MASFIVGGRISVTIFAYGTSPSHHLAVQHFAREVKIRCGPGLLKPVVAASVNWANIFNTDVWKAHSDDAPAGVGSVSTSGDPGGSSGSLLSDRGDILPDFLLAQRQSFVQQCVK